MITGQLSEPFQDLLLKKKKDYSMDDKTSYEVLHHIVGIYHLSQFMSHAELNSLFQQLLWIDARNSGRLKAIAF